VVAKLSLPKFDSMKILNTIIDERVHHKDYFNKLKGDWIGQLLSYQISKGDPCVLTPLNLSSYFADASVSQEEETRPKNIKALADLTLKKKKSLQGLYRPASDKTLHTTLGIMRDKHGLKYCPCCGEPGKPTTLDHYLPQSVFPELSVVVENLTPMCIKCQGLKKDFIKSANDERLFIHPYFDPIDDVVFELDISPPYKNPSSFIAHVPAVVRDPFRSIVVRHITKIEFLDRFEEFCISEYTDLLSTLAEAREDETRASVENTIKTFLSKAKRGSPNKWEAIFYRGILDNQDLLDYLEHADLSEYLEEPK
jgi:hypothetical protein